MCPHFFLQSNDKKLLSLSCRSFMRMFLQYVYDRSVSGGGRRLGSSRWAAQSFCGGKAFDGGAVERVGWLNDAIHCPLQRVQGAYLWRLIALLLPGQEPSFERLGQ
jgi:hypothetical protein